MSPRVGTENGALYPVRAGGTAEVGVSGTPASAPISCPPTGSTTAAR